MADQWSTLLVSARGVPADPGGREKDHTKRLRVFARLRKRPLRGRGESQSLPSGGLFYASDADDVAIDARQVWAAHSRILCYFTG
jgi:hypothetical protein